MKLQYCTVQVPSLSIAWVSLFYNFT